MADDKKEEKMKPVEQDSSLSILFANWNESVDRGHERLSKLEDAYIESVKEMANQFDKNQLTFREFLEQVKTEQQDWERRFREECLTATAGMQFLFPFQSLEKINEMFEQATRCKENWPEMNVIFTSHNERGKLVIEWLEKNVAVMRKNREQYLTALKKTASSVFEQQQKYVNCVQEQMKQLFFPFQSYIEKHQAN